MIYEEVFDEFGNVIPYQKEKNKGRNLGSKSNRSSASAMEGSKN